jgi:hypothetical protein
VIAEILEVKVCSKCCIPKYRQDFSRMTASRDGRQAQCKKCMLGYQREWARGNPKRKEIIKRYERSHREVARRAARKQRELHPEKIRARMAVKGAIRSGRLIKPDTCGYCHYVVEDLTRLHGHHEDYSKPLEVEWLCQNCHEALHADEMALAYRAAKRTPGDDKLMKESAPKKAE